MSFSNPMHHADGARRPLAPSVIHDEIVDVLDEINWAAFAALDALPDGPERNRLAEAVRRTTQTLLRELQH